MRRRMVIRVVMFVVVVITIIITSNTNNTSNKVNGVDREVLKMVLDSEGYLAGGELRDQEIQPYSRHAFNVKVSNNLPLIRALPDTRHPQCVGVEYDMEMLPTVSVIITFHNEARSTLLRTIYSVLHRTPTHLLTDIILVDDSSDDGEYSDGSEYSYDGFDWDLNFRWVALTKEERILQNTHPTNVYSSPVVAGGVFLVGRVWWNTIQKYDTELNVWGSENIEISFKSWQCGGSVLISPCSHIGHVFRPRHPYTFPQGYENTHLRNSRRVAEVWMDDFIQFFYETQPSALQVPYGSVSDGKRLRQELDCIGFGRYLNKVYPELATPSIVKVAYGALKQGDRCIQAPTILHTYRLRLGKRTNNKNNNNKNYKNMDNINKYNNSNKIKSSSSNRNNKRRREIYDEREINFVTRDEREMVTLVECEEESKRRPSERRGKERREVGQHWAFTQDGWVMLSRSVGKERMCLTVLSPDDPRVRLHTCQAGSQQRWSRQGVLLVHASSDLCLDSSSLHGALVTPCRPSLMSQQWHFSVELRNPPLPIVVD
ncbi:hypothetical protein Pmani_008652 [Petrolisthes manimaculis]|uniref:Polypeptide N-acetylgalactosaminyltransferase n=1 Tax=Petrolisthes manimaculis TaxID=1843537 RepID=A0AAE1Q6F3_9EUCA|nr:hypothetical protein Pmani_008652 [Petrolisthes manimaculis]